MTGINSTNKEIISGVTAGTLTTVITHPLDVIKIRLQLQRSGSNVFKIFKDLAVESGGRNIPVIVRNVYRGVGTNLLGNSLAWGIYFGSYRYSKDLVHTLNSGDFKDSSLKSYEYLISALSAGMFTAILTNPIWVLKTRILSTSKETPGAYKNFTDGASRILKDEGLKGFWKGLTPSLVGVFQGALQFTLYDTLKFQLFKEDSAGQLKTYEYIGISAMSKIIAALTFYPCQLIKARLQDYGRERRSAVGVILEISKKEGLSGFYKGIIPNILRVLPATCITFTVYEHMKRLV